MHVDICCQAGPQEAVLIITALKKEVKKEEEEKQYKEYENRVVKRSGMDRVDKQAQEFHGEP